MKQPDNKPPEAEDLRFMREAYRQAKKSLANDDVPVGCVIVRNGEIIARAYNRRVKDANVLHHCEILALKKACKRAGDWRLEGCTVYITLEPCPMCAGALVQARVDRVVIGAVNPKAGCGGSVMNLLAEPKFNHQAVVETGVLEAECSALISDFFRKLRRRHEKGHHPV
ncbi:MAG: tRNA adenosine(34) deaminase TadA [Eubacteriales bacterium]|nr:tRNA adenosine(34) deaminase TadA [Eubacteriales bacterium]